VVLNAANNNMGNERAFQEQLGPVFAQSTGIFSADAHEQLIAWYSLNRYLVSSGAVMPEGTQLAALVASFQMAEAAKRSIVMRTGGVLDHLPTYAKLNVPLLMFHGTDDQIVLPRASEQIQAVNPKARLILMDNVGHAPNWQGAGKFNQALLEFAKA
jgi:pimeloyl-ACP methyl ester carboxylesterase